MQQLIAAQDNPHGQTSLREGKDAPRQKDFRARAWHLFPPQMGALSSAPSSSPTSPSGPVPARFKAVADVCELVGPCLAAAWCLAALRRACPGPSPLDRRFHGGRCAVVRHRPDGLVLVRNHPASGLPVPVRRRRRLPCRLPVPTCQHPAPAPPPTASRFARARASWIGLMLMAGIVTLSWFFILPLPGSCHAAPWERDTAGQGDRDGLPTGGHRTALLPARIRPLGTASVWSDAKPFCWGPACSPSSWPTPRSATKRCTAPTTPARLVGPRLDHRLYAGRQRRIRPHPIPRHIWLGEGRAGPRSRLVALPRALCPGARRRPAPVVHAGQPWG